MSGIRLRQGLLLGTALLILGGCGRPATRPAIPSSAGKPAARIEPKADKALRDMCRTLANAQTFRFEAEEMYPVPLDTGQMILYTNRRTVSVRRPDRLAATLDGDLGKRQFCYDGRKFRVVDLARKICSQTDAPSELDAMLDHLIEKYHVRVPLIDILYRDPYPGLTQNVIAGEYIGRGKMSGRDCHHLAFHLESIDWQVWIDAGKEPVPWKVVITYSQLPGQPEYTATFSRWDLSPSLVDSAFELRPPADCRLVPVEEFVKLQKEGRP